MLGCGEMIYDGHNVTQYGPYLTKTCETIGPDYKKKKKSHLSCLMQRGH